MNKILIQNTHVPALGFGTWQLKGDDAQRATESALELGYRHIDTAAMYGNEREVGAAIASSGIPRDQIWLTTKVWYEDAAAKDVGVAVHRCLERLGVGYVDLMLLHWPNDEVPLEETMSAMNALLDIKATRLVGVANFTPAQLKRAMTLAPIACIQVEHHPYLAQSALHAIAVEHDLLLTAYSPLARGAVADDTVLRTIGEGYGKSPAQVALRWLVQQPRVAAIPKAASAKHRAENIDIFDFALTDDEMTRIGALNQDRRLIDPDFAPDWERRPAK